MFTYADVLEADVRREKEVRAIILAMARRDDCLELGDEVSEFMAGVAGRNKDHRDVLMWHASCGSTVNPDRKLTRVDFDGADSLYTFILEFARNKNL